MSLERSIVAKIDIDGVAMIDTRTAAQQVGWSHDYVARLAREEKVVGAKVGRQWYVDGVSLERYVASIELEKQVRAKHLREERQREQIIHEQRRSLDEVATHTVNAWQRVVLGVGQTISVLALGLLSGYLLYVVEQDVGMAKVVATTWQSVAVASGSERGVPSGKRLAEVASGASDTSPGAQVPSINNIAQAVTRSSTREERERPFVLLGAYAQTDETAYVQSLFSDPVEILWSEDGARGVVVPQLVDTVGEPVEVLLVPNNAQPLTE